MAEVKKMIQTEKELFEFELFYSATVSQKERVKSATIIRKIRGQNWKNALKTAKGDENKALSIFASSYDSLTF